MLRLCTLAAKEVAEGQAGQDADAEDEEHNLEWIHVAPPWWAGIYVTS
jgi:hypothetical protein